MKQVYMDHSATTATDPAVTEAMLPYFLKIRQSSSPYTIGRQARRAIEESRQKVADLIGAKKEEIIFTGSGTESETLRSKEAPFGTVQKATISLQGSKNIMQSCNMPIPGKKWFQSNISPCKQRRIESIDRCCKAITPQTILISIMHANNEIGTIQPIAEIGKIAKEKRYCLSYRCCSNKQGRSL